MSDKILGFNKDAVYMVIIILILIILGLVTANYYSYVTLGNKSVMSAGLGGNIAIMPKQQQ